MKHNPHAALKVVRDGVVNGIRAIHRMHEEQALTDGSKFTIPTMLKEP